MTVGHVRLLRMPLITPIPEAGVLLGRMIVLVAEEVDHPGGEVEADLVEVGSMAEVVDFLAVAVTMGSLRWTTSTEGWVVERRSGICRGQSQTKAPFTVQRNSYI